MEFQGKLFAFLKRIYYFLFFPLLVLMLKILLVKPYSLVVWVVWARDIFVCSFMGAFRTLVLVMNLIHYLITVLNHWHQPNR